MFLREKRQCEEQIAKVAQLDFKQMKLLLKCSQEEHKENPDESGNARMTKTLKNHVLHKNLVYGSRMIGFPGIKSGPAQLFN